MVSCLTLPHQALSTEKISTAEHAERDLGVDRVLGNAEPPRHLAMRQTIDLAERDHPPAALGQRADSFVENRKFMSMVDGLGYTGHILYHGQAFDFS